MRKIFATIKFFYSIFSQNHLVWVFEMILSTLSGPQGKTNKSSCFLKRGGRVTPFIWRIRSCATGQGMVFDFSVLSKLYNCVRIWPNYKQDEICLYSYKTNDCNVNLLIVIREDWL